MGHPVNVPLRVMCDAWRREEEQKGRNTDLFWQFRKTNSDAPFLADLVSGSYGYFRCADVNVGRICACARRQEVCDSLFHGENGKESGERLYPGSSRWVSGIVQVHVKTDMLYRWKCRCAGEVKKGICSSC